MDLLSSIRRIAWGYLLVFVTSLIVWTLNNLCMVMIERKERASVTNALSDVVIRERLGVKLVSEVWVVITGANSGIGLALTERFASLGCQVVMVCRSEVRGKAAKSEMEQRMRQKTGVSARSTGGLGASSDKDGKDGFKGIGHNLHLVIGDMSSPHSVKTAASHITNLTQNRVDLVYLNAGSMSHTGSRWEMFMGLTSLEKINYFVETSRLTPHGESFIKSAPHSVTETGEVSETIKACIIGHSLLIHHLAGSLERGYGRIVWTGSRAADPKRLSWVSHSPHTPAMNNATTEPGSDQTHKSPPFDVPAAADGDDYGAAKYLTDVMSRSLNTKFKSTTSRSHIVSLVGCPGLTITNAAPPVVAYVEPFAWLVASLWPGWRVKPERGCEVLVRLGVARVKGNDSELIEAGGQTEDRETHKYGMRYDKLLPVFRGVHPVSAEDAAKLEAMVKGFLGCSESEVE